MTLPVELVYVDGCPKWTVADERLAEALKVLRRDDVVVQRRQVRTVEQAEEQSFLGSASIRMDGIEALA